MGLRMPQPWKHPTPGMYHFRRGVPKDLWTVVGKREEKWSLGTKDLQVAKRSFIDALAKCEARWAALRAGARRLSESEAHKLAAGIHDRWLIIYGDNPTLQLTWHPEWFDRLWTEPEIEGTPDAIRIDQVVIPAMRRFSLAQTRFVIEDKGLILDELSHFLLQRATAAALQRASLKLRGVEDGMIDPRDFAQTITALRQTDHAAQVPKPERLTLAPPTSRTLTALFEGWWREAEAAGRKISTYHSYRSTMASFVAFVGHENPSSITAEHVIAFKDHRLNTVSAKTGKRTSAKTVKDSDLAALKAIFGWAVINRLMAENPAAGITIKLGKRAQLRPKRFTDEEAHSILRATLSLAPRAELPTTAAAKRWIPWLCALTGARVGEMAQLRKRDLRQEKGFWVIHVTPEADTVKTSKARDVVLHRQLVAQGFPDFVRSSEDGYIFFRVGEGNSVEGTKKGLTNRVREFIRTIVTDRNVDPNHGWRHRFKTVGREAGVDAFVLDKIQGHKPRTEGESYGEVSIKTKAAAMALFPEIDLGSDMMDEILMKASNDEQLPATPPLT